MAALHVQHFRERLAQPPDQLALVEDVHQRRAELAQTEPRVVARGEQGTVDTGLERLLERRDQHDRNEGQRDRRAHQDGGCFGTELLRQQLERERPRHEHDGRREQEAGALADDEVHVHQPVADHGVRHEAGEGDAADAAQGIRVEAVERDLDHRAQ